MTHSLSSVQLPRRPALFYRTDQIRFRQLSALPLRKHLSPKITIAPNPWLSLKDKELQKLLERLDDQPAQLYTAIQARRNKQRKFKLLKQQLQNKQNDELIVLERKKKNYEEQFRTLLRNKKTSKIDILLPKLQFVRYVFHDRLHSLKLSQKSSH